MATKKPHTANVGIRWFIRRDMAEVIEIENRSFEYPWTEEEFLLCLRKRNVIGTVAESRDSIYGFMVYELQQNHLHLLNLAVAPEIRRTGIGAALIQRLIDKLSPDRRRRIVTECRESNLPAQLFFARCGFRGRFKRDWYANGENAIQFTYRVKQTPNATQEAT